MFMIMMMIMMIFVTMFSKHLLVECYILIRVSEIRSLAAFFKSPVKLLTASPGKQNNQVLVTLTAT